MQPFGKRYRVALAVMVRLITVVVIIAGIALVIAEPSWRSVRFAIAMWVIAVPLTALGYVRKMDRLAAQVPVSPASNSPTTTVDIRTGQAH
jgi:hypothetical protein